ncbi:uncharacterized protein LOC106740149 [Alligator mississippiensis]|uniref:uncharacterized protein LOC106740149 n=1 Tax=Alligator mississippiensis TaxID=8496 RepID=UPI00287764D7|nr:uncharacterized protein LOC106740149 [Alligator mississippiensis]
MTWSFPEAGARKEQLLARGGRHTAKDGRSTRLAPDRADEMNPVLNGSDVPASRRCPEERRDGGRAGWRRAARQRLPRAGTGTCWRAWKRTAEHPGARGWGAAFAGDRSSAWRRRRRLCHTAWSHWCPGCPGGDNIPLGRELDAAQARKHERLTAGAGSPCPRAGTRVSQLRPSHSWQGVKGCKGGAATLVTILGLKSYPLTPDLWPGKYFFGIGGEGLLS